MELLETVLARHKDGIERIRSNLAKAGQDNARILSIAREYLGFLEDAASQRGDVERLVEALEIVVSYTTERPIVIGDAVGEAGTPLRLDSRMPVWKCIQAVLERGRGPLTARELAVEISKAGRKMGSQANSSILNAIKGKEGTLFKRVGDKQPYKFGLVGK